MEKVSSLESKQFVFVTLETDLALLDDFMAQHNIPEEKREELKEHWMREFDDFEVKVKWFLAEWIAEDITKAIKGDN